ncbi:hypothetical protein PL81_31585 [Streptomyces sp. RSD-27]|nr:hypothetical protein PL81_31585 [Streptomyces sp. RSD-27]
MHVAADPGLRVGGRERRGADECRGGQERGGRDALERGATLRLLYRSTAAADRATQAYVAALIEAGGEVRAVAGRFPPMIIVDQEGAARRLRISDRLVNRGLAEARERLGLRTTFQLTIWYGRWLERTVQQ